MTCDAIIKGYAYSQPKDPVLEEEHVLGFRGEHVLGVLGKKSPRFWESTHWPGPHHKAHACYLEFHHLQIIFWKICQKHLDSAAAAADRTEQQPTNWFTGTHR